MSASEFETLHAVEIGSRDAGDAVLVADAVLPVILHAPYLLLLEHDVLGRPVFQ